MTCPGKIWHKPLWQTYSYSDECLPWQNSPVGLSSAKNKVVIVLLLLDIHEYLPSKEKNTWTGVKKKWSMGSRKEGRVASGG